MKVKNVFVTRDYKEHKSIQKAEDHALEMAHRLLQDLLVKACPYLEAPYKVSQDIILYLISGKELKEVVAWIEDANKVEEN